MEQKVAIDNASISGDEVRERMRHFGHDDVREFSSLRGGFSSQNLHCRCKSDEDGEHDKSLVLKLANAQHSFEDVALQVEILVELEKVRFPTNYAHRLLEGRWDGERAGTAPLRRG